MFSLWGNFRKSSDWKNNAEFVFLDPFLLENDNQYDFLSNFKLN